MNEKIALKELIVFLVNTQEENSFLRFLKEIVPLELDVALANQYLEDLCKGTVSQELIDTVEYLYEEHSYYNDRFQMVDLIGNSRVIFEFSTISKCYDMLKSLISGDYDCYKFAIEFPSEITYLEDDETTEILKDIPEICEDFIKQHEMGIDTTNKFLEIISDIYCKLANKNY